MKKFIALVGAALLSAVVFAENTMHFGAYFPLASFKASPEDEDYTVDLGESGVGGSFDYTHVADGGFTFKVGVGLAHVSTSDVVSAINGDDLGGVDFDTVFGWGGSFIHDERMTLSFTGNLGFRIQSLSASEDVKVSGVTVARGYETDFFSILCYIGPEISYTYRFNDHLGAFANFGIFYNIGYSYYSTSDVEYNGTTLYYGDDDTIITKGFIFQPKLGISVTF